jgi:hypothetical protein
MKRNDICINKTIHHLVKEKANISNQIFINFKKLYFDMMINLKNEEDMNKGAFNNLNRKTFHRLINISLARFKNIEYDENNIEDKLEENPIDISTELKSFLKSCGNILDDNDIEFLIHIIENYDKFEKNGKILTYRDLYDIWGALIHFSNTKSDKIVEYVFQTYTQEKEDLDSSLKKKVFLKSLTIEKVSEFFNFYHDYFSDKQAEYIIDECKISFSRDFTIDALSHMLTSLRKYHTN